MRAGNRPILILSVLVSAAFLSSTIYAPSVHGDTPDFTVSPYDSSVTFQQGWIVLLTIFLTSVNGFSGTVAMTDIAPPGFTVSFNPSPSVTVTPGGYDSVTMQITSTVSGSYNITVIGTSGSLTHSAQIAITVTPPPPNFSVSVRPSSITILAGQSSNATLTITSLYGYSGNVSLSITAHPLVFPWPAYNVTASLDSTNLSISPGHEAATTVRIVTGSITPMGRYSVWITGMATGVVQVHQALVELSVGPYYALTPSLTSIAIPAGSDASSQILLTSRANFSITANFQVSYVHILPYPYCNPPCTDLPVISLTPNTVELPVFGTNATTLTVSTTSTTSRGSYTIQVVGEGCVCFPRDFMITFNVTDFSIGKTPTSIQLSRGSLTSVNITASGVFGFTGTISLTATIIPVLKRAPALSSLETIELSAAEPTGVVSLTVSTQHSTRVGTYMILIIASSANISRTLFISLSVTK